jgi:CRP-like cAMP-binding protein
MFVILEGRLEVRDGDALLGVFGPGDIFGAMAFLFARPRVVDMYAATDCRILSLSEGTVRKAIDSDARGAAHLMLNIAKTLCLRLLQTR